MSSRRCFLKSVKGEYPSIEITADEYKIVGRTPEFQLRDERVSRVHLKVRADFTRNRIIFEVLGINPSILNHVKLEANTKYEAKHDDIIEILSNRYPYKVHFDNASDEQESATLKRQKSKIDLKRDKAPFDDIGTWHSYNDGQLIVHTPNGCAARQKIAAYDMDGTLITTKTGKVFPAGVDDWKLAFDSVKSTLTKNLAEKYKVVIFTNQAGLSIGKISLSDLRKKIENIVKHIDVPVQVFIATGESMFRKPNTMMWQALTDHLNGDVKINEDECFYVGDAAGRPGNKALKMKKDHSNADRLFAMNLNLKFFTPEEHFIGNKIVEWNKAPNQS